MGGFLYVRKEPQEAFEDVSARHRDSIEAFRKKHLPLAATIVTDRFLLFVFAKINVSAQNIVHFDNGDFAVVTGTLIYDGVAGIEALRRLYDVFPETTDLFSKALGHYCVLLCKHGDLFAFNDYHGLYRVFRDQSHDVISSSFLAVLKSCSRRTPSEQELYEYITYGVTHGSQTFVQEIRLLENTHVHQLQPRPRTVAKCIQWRPLDPVSSLDHLVPQVADALVDYFRILKSNFADGGITSALSGGFDSRLMLALMRRAGIQPQLYVYGRPNSPDVIVAKRITQSLGLPIDHVDKSTFPRPDLDQFAAVVEEQFHLKDGQDNQGVFDSGADIATRYRRTKQAHLHLNGGGGEIYRDYWLLPGRDLAVASFLRASFDRIDFSIYTPRFNKTAYLLALADKIKVALNISIDVLTRSQVELLYTLFRSNYWMAQNNCSNNTLSFSLTPFAEPTLNIPSSGIPIGYKRAGLFEAALIRHLDRELAAFSSIYGFNFDEGPGWRARLTNAFWVQTPIAWRPTIRRYRLRRSRGAMPFYLEAEYLSKVLDTKDLEISRYVHMDKVRDDLILNRALTAELVLTDRF